MDDVARALLGRGAHVAARELLHNVAGRGGPDAQRCGQLLAHLDAHPEAPHVVPNMVVSAELAAAIASEGYFREAALVARTLDPSVRAIELLAALELILAPLPSDTPARVAATFAEARERADRALALQLAHDAAASEEVRRRAMLIVDFRRSQSASAGAEVTAHGVAASVSETVRSLMEHRDWARGERELRAQQDQLGAGDALTSLLRLRETMQRLFEEETGQGPSTVPLQGPAVAVFQLRMGNLVDAERTLRRTLRDNPADARSQALLHDIEALRTVANRTSAPPSAPEWLDKRGRKPSIDGWAPSKRSPTPGPERGADEYDAITSVMRPDEEAELHLRQGRVDKAIRIYEELAQRYPERPHFANRAAEIRAREAQRELVFVDEMTIRHTVRKSEPPIGEEPTGTAVTVVQPAQRVAPTPPVADSAMTPVLVSSGDDEEMTFGATEVTSQRIELGSPEVAASEVIAERVLVRNIVRIS